jgi:VanZ family protein
MGAMNLGRTALRWVPAVMMMIAIFSLSSLPADRLPYFGAYDFLVKKAGHASGYALLGLTYYYALPKSLSSGYRWGMAVLMAVLFALSDEFHQSFVAGRTSTLRDVMIDGGGAAIATAVAALYSSNSSSKSNP